MRHVAWRCWRWLGAKRRWPAPLLNVALIIAARTLRHSAMHWLGLWCLTGLVHEFSGSRFAEARFSCNGVSCDGFSCDGGSCNRLSCDGLSTGSFLGNRCAANGLFNGQFLCLLFGVLWGFFLGGLWAALCGAFWSPL